MTAGWTLKEIKVLPLSILMTETKIQLSDNNNWIVIITLKTDDLNSNQYLLYLIYGAETTWGRNRLMPK